MTKLVAQRYRMVKVADLKPHPRNPRQGDVGGIAQSIEENGFFGAVAFQAGTNTIIFGEHRWRAAMEAGLKQIPALEMEVDDDAAMRIMLADNRANDLATYDVAKLAELLQELAAGTVGLSGTMFSGDDLDEMIRDLETQTRLDAAAAPALPKLPEWEAPGEALRLIVECDTAEDMERLMDFLGIEDGRDRVRVPFRETKAAAGDGQV